MTTAAGPWICPTCNGSVSTLYCSQCGERRLRPWDLTLRGLLVQLLQAVTSIDSRLLRSFRLLLLRPGSLTTAFVRDFKPGREQCWVAERAGMMAGAVFVVDAGDDVAQLRLLHVEPWARGLGIGSALVAECVRFAREAGYRTVRLWTHTVLTSARRIYEGQGFRIVETAEHHTFGKAEQGETWELSLPG